MLSDKALLLFEKLLRISINTIVFFMMARIFSPEEFGEYNYIIAVSLIITAFSTFGFESYLVKVFVEKRLKLNRVIAVALITRGGVLAILCLFFSAFLYQESKSLFILISIIFIPFSVFDVFVYYFESNRRFKLISIIKIIILIIVSSLKVALIVFDFEIQYLYFAYFFDFFISFLIFYIFYKKDESDSLATYDLSVFKSLVKRTWPLIPSSIALIIYLKSDVVMIKALLGESHVAPYSIAIKIIEAFYFIAQITMTIAVPMLINVRRESKDKYKIKLRRVMKELLLFSLCSIFTALIVSKFVDVYILEYKYPMFLSVLYIYLPVIFLVYFRVFLTRFLHIENLVMCSLLLHTSTAILNIVFNYFLITSYGLNGAALSTVLAYSMSFFIVIAYFKRLRFKLYRVFK